MFSKISLINFKENIYLLSDESFVLPRVLARTRPQHFGK